jgi:hypothetical protein
MVVERGPEPPMSRARNSALMAAGSARERPIPACVVFTTLGRSPECHFGAVAETEGRLVVASSSSSLLVPTSPTVPHPENGSQPAVTRRPRFVSDRELCPMTNPVPPSDPARVARPAPAPSDDTVLAAFANEQIRGVTSDDGFETGALSGATMFWLTFTTILGAGKVRRRDSFSWSRPGPTWAVAIGASRQRFRGPGSRPIVKGPMSRMKWWL